MQKPLLSGSSMASESQMNRIPGLVCSPPPRLCMTRKLLALTELDCGAPIHNRLLRGLQLREVLARHLDLDRAIHLLLSGVLLDGLNEAVHYLRTKGLGSPAVVAWAP